MFNFQAVLARTQPFFITQRRETGRPVPIQMQKKGQSLCNSQYAPDNVHVVNSVQVQTGRYNGDTVLRCRCCIPAQNTSFFSTFPVFVLSLSWQNDRLSIKMAPKGARVFRTVLPRQAAAEDPLSVQDQYRLERAVPASHDRFRFRLDQPPALCSQSDAASPLRASQASSTSRG
eukprot:COSAG06_NODE_92_length_24690_cov_4.684071_16_plen_174_part_00